MHQLAPRRRTTNRRYPKWAAALLLAAAVSACGPPPPPNVNDGHVAPPFSAATIDGITIDYPSSSNGNPSIVFVWSTWCPYCKVLLPRLSEIRADYENHGVEVIAVNAKERGQGDPAVFMREAGYDFVTIAEGDAIADAWEVDYLPGLFVVDGNGTIVFRRKWTELPAGSDVADLWERQVRKALDTLTTS